MNYDIQLNKVRNFQKAVTFALCLFFFCAFFMGFVGVSAAEPDPSAKVAADPRITRSLSEMSEIERIRK